MIKKFRKMAFSKCLKCVIIKEKERKLPKKRGKTTEEIRKSMEQKARCAHLDKRARVGKRVQYRQ